MSITKHKIFKVEITNNVDIEDVSTNEINLFLENSNHIYVNHSIGILTEDVHKYGNFLTENKYIVISLIYKDLNSTPLNLKSSGKKMKEIVSKEVKENNAIQMPTILTDFDKELGKIDENDKISFVNPFN